MTLYCDESGGLSASAMTFAAVSIDADAAAAVIERFRRVTRLRGEVKGSRISLVERAYLLELVARHGGRAWVAMLQRRDLRLPPGTPLPADRDVYAALLDLAVSKWLPETGGTCTDVVIDDGRYDPAVLGIVRADVQALLGQWGRASLIESHRSDGVQIADVIANCLFNMAVGGPRADRIAAIVDPFLGDHVIRTVRLDPTAIGAP
jgi:hypothetical protein